MKKSTRIIFIILQVLVSLSFLSAGIFKLIHNPMEVALFDTVHLSSVLMIMGVIEVLIAIGIWCKSTRTIALLFATATLGGAIAETISTGGMSQVAAPIIPLILVWIIFFMDRQNNSVVM